MEQIQPSENLIRLVDIESLLGKFCRAPSAERSDGKQEEHETCGRRDQSTPVLFRWPGEALLPALRSRLPDAPAIVKCPGDTGMFPSSAIESIAQDVMASRERLLALNPGRRRMVESRLQILARRIAAENGERFARPIELGELLKESQRDGEPGSVPARAWRAFASEVALHQLLGLFLLKSLDSRGWRPFESSDLGRMNFAVHSFLSQRADGFSNDRYCWNFARPNIYSWYVPSARAATVLQSLVAEGDRGAPPSRFWSSRQLGRFFPNPTEAELASCHRLLDFLEAELGAQLLREFQGRPACRKVFLPALESGAFAVAVLERILARIPSPQALAGAQLHRALWACENECIEAYRTEVLILMKVLERLPPGATASDDIPHPRLPHAIHVAQLLGLELHNQDQLPLAAESAKLYQGTAARIQHETFDLAVVTDHPDRAKSGRWLKELTDQAPYWRSLASSNTALNWGELHLFLAMNKLGNGGVCAYLSHRALPETGDGDRLRRALLNLATLECAVELPAGSGDPYRHLYVFRREDDKHKRDQHRPRFGRLDARDATLRLDRFEEASSPQHEIAERGWEHLFARGAAPLIRHLDQKFPKLFQLAALQSGEGIAALARSSALELRLEASGAVRFAPLSREPAPGQPLVFPHNPVDLPWIACLLNSAPAQFWLKRELAGGALPKPQALRSCPIVDLSRSTHPESASFRAHASRFAALEGMLEKYRPMFASAALDELRPEGIRQFYPSQLFCRLSELPDIRVQYADRGRSALPPESLGLAGARIAEAAGATSPKLGASGGAMAMLELSTRQGPVIQLLAPLSIRDYLLSQLKELPEHTWGEALELITVPRDITLFAAQVAEITRVTAETARELGACRDALERLALELFEISTDLRQFLTR